MSHAGDEEGLEFEPEDDDLMDEDAGDGAQIPKLRSAITGKKTKGRGFRDDIALAGGRNNAGFDSLDSDSGPGPQRSIEGWIILVTGVHEEAQEDHLLDLFGGFGSLKNLHLNLDRRTGFVKGYALIEYETFEEAHEAINGMNGVPMLDQTLSVDWAFSRGPFKWKNAKRSVPRRQRSRSPIRKH